MIRLTLDAPDVYPGPAIACYSYCCAKEDTVCSPFSTIPQAQVNFAIPGCSRITYRGIRVPAGPYTVLGGGGPDSCPSPLCGQDFWAQAVITG